VRSIDDIPYWDGGYMGNPALFPLFDETTTDDIVLVQIDPVERRQTHAQRAISAIGSTKSPLTAISCANCGRSRSSGG
jgi:predicted acylesterase/phospholipase RssA